MTKDDKVCEFWKDDVAKKEIRNTSCMKTFQESVQYINEMAQVLKDDFDE